MRIAIDGYEANVEQRLGSSQVAFELLSGLEKIDKKNDYTIFLPTSALGDLPKERKGWEYKILKPKRLWTRIALPIALYSTKQKPDLIFSPTHYIPRFSPVKRIATIFDLSFLHFPEMFNKRDLWQLKNWTKFSVLNSDHIITISGFSRKDICSSYNIPREKVTIAYPGYDKEKFKIQNLKFKIEEIRKKYKIEGRYIIYIGTIQPRKNLIRLIDAVAKIEDLRLLIVGKTTGEGREGWMYKNILDHPEKLGIQDRVIFAGFVPTEDLQHLLSEALAFVLPSLYEGFGLPILEAMACGVPVICSKVSSLPEVCGKAGLLVDPCSVTQIEQAIRTVTTDKKLRQRKIKEGLLQVKKFSWEKMSRTVLKVFEKMEIVKGDGGNKEN